LIVDTDGELRSNLAAHLRRTGFDSLEAASGQEAIMLARSERPAVVVVDLRLPDVNGYEICRELRDEFADELAIVLVSADRTEPLDRSAGLLVGADDYVAKPFDASELLARVRQLARRTGARSRPIERTSNNLNLTDRELEVLRLLADGRKPREIAAVLVISEKTVSSHIQRVLGKLGVNSRTQAVALAYRAGLIQVGLESAPADVRRNARKLVASA
jgi:DNA-binding NarL/FixJ family response regulator